VHIFDTKTVDITMGKKGLEKLSEIYGTPALNEVTDARINMGFFNFDGSTEHIGGYARQGVIYDPSWNYYEDVNCISGVCQIFEASKDTQFKADWSFSVSWSLIKNGFEDLTNANKIYHSRIPQPRTMAGQLKDLSYVFVVVDGRSSTNRGVTAKEQARIMLDLGCNVAWNHDGGGSSEMIVGNKIVNRLSDRRERSIGSAMVSYSIPVEYPNVSMTHRSNHVFVHLVQRLLVARGYDPKGIDGLYGFNTYTAIKQFQRENGLKPDGWVGTLTWEILKM